MRAATLCLLCLASCGGGGLKRGLPVTAPDATAEIVFCRFKREGHESEHTMRVSSREGLANEELRDRPGIERDVRVHPSDARIVYTRETNGPSSREVFIGWHDGSGVESRLTRDRAIDGSPTWSADGTRVLFSSDRGGTGFRLWSVDTLGNDARLVNDDGSEQHDPDALGRLIVYSRRDPSAVSPRAELWLYDTQTMLAMPLTDGGTESSDDGVPGDYEAAFSPDGLSVVFTRSAGGDRRRLMQVDVATHTVTPLGDGAGSDRWPRWSPSGDAIFVARRRPLDGINGLVLFEVDATGDDPVAVAPDERFDYPGFDPLPNLGPRPSLDAPRDADFANLRAELAFGAGTYGTTESLESDDGFVLRLVTAEYERRQRAGLRVEIPLGVDDPLELGRVTVAVRAAVSRDDGDPLVRLTLFNTIEDRNDTILERAPEGTGLETFEFTTQSLAHVSRDAVIVIAVIADLPNGDRAELAVDSVRVTVRTRT